MRHACVRLCRPLACCRAEPCADVRNVADSKQGQTVFSECGLCAWRGYARKHSAHHVRKSTAFPGRRTSPVAWYASCSGFVPSCFVIEP
jgi:hypothetical protein